MKKTIIFLSAFIFAFMACVNAGAYIPETDVSYFFAGERYGISNIDTNGEIFVGVNENKIAVSDDFESWDIHCSLDDVSAVQYLNGKFCAFTKDYTYVSADGAAWKKNANNLPAVPEKEYIIKNNGSVVLFARDDTGPHTGTYQTFDGITWKRVLNIPDGIWMSHVNGQIMFESTGYMRGFYYSDTGEEFTPFTIDGYDESYGGFNLRYNGSEYIVYDFWRSGDSELGYKYSSTELTNWSTERIPIDTTEILNNPNGHYVNINGQLHAFSQNGYDWVYKDGSWQQGEYHGLTGLIEPIDENHFPIQAYVYYNFTDHGIFMWSTNHNAAFIKNSGEVLKYNGQERHVDSIFVKDDKFIAQNWLLEGQWESENGKTWIKTASKDDYSQYYRSIKATNGSATFESEILERGSWRFHEDNKEITGTLTEPDGNVKKVVFENTKHSDYITAYSGNGFFLLGDYDRRFWISHDGITRNEYIYLDDIESAANLYVSGTHFLITTQAGIHYIGDMSQFDKIPMNNAIKVKLGEEYLSFEQSPVIENSRTLASMRFLFEKMGARVDWNDDTKTVSVSYGEIYIEIPINSSTAKVNGTEKPLDVPARLINDKTMLPLRFIAEEMGYTVNYIAETKTAEITK